MMHQMMMMMTEVIQMVHCLMPGGCCWVIPIVGMLWMIEQVMIVMADEHRCCGSRL
jgi:hypothetical protein